MRQLAFGIVLGLGAAIAAGCAHPTVSVDTIASTEASIRAAQVAGAEQYPQAALHLHYARLEQAEAQDWVRRGATEQATRAYLRAQSDADLAYALARAASSGGVRPIGGGLPPTSGGSN